MESVKDQCPHVPRHEAVLTDLLARSAVTESKVTALDSFLVGIKSDIARIGDDVCKLRAKLYEDNGDISLSSRVRGLESEFIRHSNQHIENDSKRAKVIWFLFATTSSLFLMEIFKWVGASIRFNP
jgi:hypothetical protein